MNIPSKSTNQPMFWPFGPIYGEGHIVRIYKEYHSVCPLVGIGTLPTPLSPASVPPPPQNRGGGTQSPAGGGLGESQFRQLEKKLSTLHTLWRRVFENYTYPLGWECNCVCAYIVPSSKRVFKNQTFSNWQ